jgi:polar amino acid transport system substrate-binding protein
MRKLLVVLAATGLFLTACASDEPTVGASGATGTTGGETGATGASGGTGGTSPSTAASCAEANSASLAASGTLTIGTDNPAFPPWFSGGETKEHDWQFNDPYTGKGYEAATAYALAEALGFSADQVTWVVVPFNQTYKPGDKDYDFAIEQISYSPKRDEAIDFSDSYYDVQQALVAVKGSAVAEATSLADLKDYSIAAPIGTTSYDYIVNTIQPNTEPGAYTTLSDTVAALNAGQVDAIVVDAPTAYYLADPFVQEVKDGVVVGLFPTAGTQEYFGLAFETGNPLVECANLAIAELKAAGTLDSIHQEWLVEKTNVGEVPEFTT